MYFSDKIWCISVCLCQSTLEITNVYVDVFGNRYRYILKLNANIGPNRWSSVLGGEQVESHYLNWCLAYQAQFTQGCGLRITFERLEKWPGRSVVAYTTRILFLCKRRQRPLWLPWKTPLFHTDWGGTESRTKEAERRQNNHYGCSRVAVIVDWVYSGRPSHRLMHAIGRLEEVQRRHKGIRSIPQIDWGIGFETNHAYYVAIIDRPLCIYSATTAMYMSPSCLIWATLEQPQFSATLVWLLWTRSKLCGDHGVHGDVWTSCVAHWKD